MGFSSSFDVAAAVFEVFSRHPVIPPSSLMITAVAFVFGRFPPLTHPCPFLFLFLPFFVRQWRPLEGPKINSPFLADNSGGSPPLGLLCSFSGGTDTPKYMWCF